MSNPVLGTLTPSGDIRMEIFKTLMTAKDAAGYTRLLSILFARAEKFPSGGPSEIRDLSAQQLWGDVLKPFNDPVCLVCPATLARVAHALEQLGLTEMAFQVSSLGKRLVQAIEMTGDGSQDRPYHIYNAATAEMWLRDVKKLNLGTSSIDGGLLSVPITSGGMVWFSSPNTAKPASAAKTRVPSSPLPIVSSVPKPQTPTPAGLPVFNPTETRFGAPRKPGSRPTLTNITTPTVTSTEREPERTPDPLSNDALIQAIRQRLGEPDTVLKGMEHSPPSVELHHYKPARRRDFHTLLTVGMSSLPMHVPEGQEGYRYAELMLLLPPDWSINKNSLTDEKLGWPMFWQMKMARYVHETRTWYHHLHNFGVVNVGQTLHPATKFSHWMLVRPETMGTVMDRLTLPDGRMVHFYAMTAIYFEENEFKMREVRGGEALWERMRASNFTDILFPSRKNVIANRPSKTVEFPHP